ncbi:GrpB family protein [Pseudonocardia sp.]|uniref:GrpB family protein n=1 Tax=Pseudonocardia sp. TaxID=60912 RepID=UPI0026358C15|nr:GrpB family protein [Pseudonocardia sp.]
MTLAEYDPTWPVLFAREADRIRDTLGASVLLLKHVGSTSVPGLAAKPIIDIHINLHVRGCSPPPEASQTSTPPPPRWPGTTPNTKHKLDRLRVLLPRDPALHDLPRKVGSILAISEGGGGTATSIYSIGATVGVVVPILYVTFPTP